jgi:hypothetical protein
MGLVIAAGQQGIARAGTADRRPVDSQDHRFLGLPE